MNENKLLYYIYICICVIYLCYVSRLILKHIKIFELNWFDYFLSGKILVIYAFLCYLGIYPPNKLARDKSGMVTIFLARLEDPYLYKKWISQICELCLRWYQIWAYYVANYLSLCCHFSLDFDENSTASLKTSYWNHWFFLIKFVHHLAR